MVFSFKRIAAVAIAGLCLVAGTASAKSILNDNPVVVTGTGPFTYTYNEQLTTDSEIHTGDFFVIVDFANYVAGSIFAPVGWTPTVELLSLPNPMVGTDGSSIAFSDSVGLQNLRFTYTALATISAPGPTNQALGAFGAQSTTSARTVSRQVGEDHNIGTLSIFTSVNGQAIEVPSAAPLPGVAVAGFGLFSLLGGKRLIKARKQ